MSHAIAAPAAKADEYTPTRLRALDVLRGVAILGTLASNIWIFVTYPATDNFRTLEAVLGQLPNGKFLALLTFMFGIGLTIQRQSAAKRDKQWPHVYFWRAVLLFLDGLFHYILVFAFDVLMAYAVAGFIVSFILLTSNRVQRWLCALAVSVHLGYLFLPVMGVRIPWLGGFGAMERADDIELTPEQLAQLNEKAQHTPVYEQTISWWDEVTARTHSFWQGREEAIFIIPMAVALFMIGSFVYRAGLFEPRGAKMRRILMGIGVVGFIADTLASLDERFLTPGSAPRYLVPIFASMLFAGGIAELYQHRQVGWMGRRFEDVGRMALSCYVGMNVISTILFSPWGFDAARFIPDSWGPYKVIVGFLFVSGILVTFAGLWRKRFSRGPLEWAWNVSHLWLLHHVTPSWAKPAGNRPTPSPVTAPETAAS